MQNGFSSLKERPAKGSIVRDVQGQRYEALEVGMRYAKLRPLNGSAERFVNLRDIYPTEAPPITQPTSIPTQTASEEFE